MAIAVQANLMQLKIAECKRLGTSTSDHEINVRSPGPVKRFRETLIVPNFLREAPIAHIHLRLREVWGQYCVMRWVFSLDAGEATDFSKLSPAAALHYAMELEIKHAELHAVLWRIRVEHRLRSDPDESKPEPSKDEKALAKRIPAEAFGKPITKCSKDELVLAGCEHAGMLAALRWIMDTRRTWGEAGIMDVAARPF